MNEEIKTIFSNFTVDNEQIDVAHIKYKGHNKKYVTWTLLPEEPALSYDNEIQYSTVMVDIDIYSDDDFIVESKGQFFINPEYDDGELADAISDATGFFVDTVYYHLV